LSAEPWKRISALFDELCELPAERQAQRLSEIAAEDPALAPGLARLLAADQTGGLLIDTPIALEPLADADLAEATPPPGRAGPYRLVGQLGRGGMADVYAGERDDGAFEQRVAVKVMRRGLDTDELLARFLRERNILAGLDHPAIARLLDGGGLDDGRPYLVMERVDGLPITTFAQRQALTVEQRLQLLLVACDAVAYAHRNLVVHRDLKPSNVLVSAAGEVKLLDFGIAKLLRGDGASDQTVRELRLLTPAYAAPEQIAGEATTTATDVWGLGALAFELLVGEAPFAGDGERMGALAKLHPPPPRASVRALALCGDTAECRRLAARLRGDLDTILAKAMALDPDRRYASAEALGDDVRRHLAGRPVLARPDSLPYRAGKFVRRHRLGVALGVTAALALVVLSALALLQARRAERERARAEHERVRAEARFADARQLANSLLFEVYDAIDELAGSTDARRLLVDKALLYLDRLSREGGDDPGLLFELAQAYQRVGDVQGLAGWANLGRTGDAVASYRSSLALFDRLLAQAPRDPRFRRGRALVENNLGATLGDRGDYGGALTHHRAVRAVFERLWNGERYEPARWDFVQILVAVGDDLWELGKSSEAAVEFEAALVQAKRYVADHPQDRRGLRGVGVVVQRLADAATHQGDFRRARDLHRTSLEIDERLAASSPDNSETQRDLAVDHIRLGIASEQAGDVAAARSEHRRALEIRERLVRLDPRDTRAALDLAESRYLLGSVEERAGDLTAAAPLLAAAVADSRRLVAEDPSNFNWKVTLAAALAELSRVARRRGDVPAADAGLREAISIREDEAVRAADSAENRIALADLDLELAERLSGTNGLPPPAACARVREANTLLGSPEEHQLLPANLRGLPVRAAAILRRCPASVAPPS
jgi:non-specific serine/threonine protein kinase/serine/threonine-protein kinase